MSPPVQQFIGSLFAILFGGGVFLYLVNRVLTNYDEKYKRLEDLNQTLLADLSKKSETFTTVLADLRIKVATLEHSIQSLNSFRKDYIRISGEIAAIKSKFQDFVDETYYPQMDSAHSRIRELSKHFSKFGSEPID